LICVKRILQLKLGILLGSNLLPCGIDAVPRRVSLGNTNSRRN
jgi:hypothetical protein